MNSRSITFHALSLVVLGVSSFGAQASVACKPVTLNALKGEIERCIDTEPGADALAKRTRCVVKTLTCADTITYSTGLASEVKVLGFSQHEEKFFVDQRHFHYREVIFNENRPPSAPKLKELEIQIGIGYQIVMRQSEVKSEIAGSVKGVAASLGLNSPRTLSLVGIVGIDPVQEDEKNPSIYRTLAAHNANTSVADYLDAYSRVDTAFRSFYTRVLAADGTELKNTAVCPQVLNMRYLGRCGVDDAKCKAEHDNNSLDMEAIASAITADVEQALCGDRAADTKGPWPNAVFAYASATADGRFGDPAKSTESALPNASGDTDQISLMYARRRHFLTRSADEDLHTEYYAAAEKGSFGSGSLFSAMLSINGAADKVKNSGYAYGYPACMGAVAVTRTSDIKSTPLPQLSGILNLYDAFNSNMGQIDRWANAYRSKRDANCNGENTAPPIAAAGTALPASTLPVMPTAAATDARNPAAPAR